MRAGCSRFEQEARAAGQLNHPNILAVYDVGTHAGAPYIVSELLEGESLRSRLRRRRAAAAQSDRLRAPDRGRARRRARQGHRPPRREARQPVHHERRAGQDPRLRHRQADAAERRRGPAHRRADRDGGRDGGRHGGLHVAGAGPRRSRRCAVRPLQLRRRFSTRCSRAVRRSRAQTAAETMAAILKEDPPEPLPPDVSPALARIVVALSGEGARGAVSVGARSGVRSGSAVRYAARPPRRRRPSRHRGAGARAAACVVALSLVAAVASWLTRRHDHRRPSRTRWPTRSSRASRIGTGTEEGAEISPDGKFVAFLADATVSSTSG